MALLVLAAAAAGFRAAILEPSVSSKKLKDSHTTLSAKCGGGSQVVSGGFAAPDRAYAGGGPYTDTTASYRSGKGRFEIKAESSGSAGKIYVTAYCGDLGPISVASKDIAVGPLNDRSVTATCPAGRVAVSGGWSGKKSGKGRARLIPFLSQRVGNRGWEVGVENSSFGGEVKLTTYAYCAELDDAPKAVVKDRPVEILSIDSISASCAKGSEAIAGGFDLATKRGYSAGASVHSSRRKAGGRTWKISLINGGRDRHGRAFAYCLPT